jgi:2-polyprenyl-6-methoxyphenol hydroxylase-like FAD-dependent oxidoreductase
METDVLIVGAGPTGLMLANQLGRRGVRTLIIERHDGPAQQSRAMAVHARTLETYQKLGIADRALALGRPGYGANMWANGRRRARIPLGEMGKGISRFPYVLMLGQDDNERILGDRLRDWGLDVRWSTELVALDQQPDRVLATIKDPDGTTRTIAAAYVAGCDGAHSAVRHLTGVAFPGAAYEQAFFVADTIATGPMVGEELNVFLWGRGFHLYCPMRGADAWRVIGILPPGLTHRDDLTFEDLEPGLRAIAGPGLTFHGCKWFSTYRIHHRAVERFREGRCFLLGDAAHVHSPMGGQGMNTGLQDACNLAWKLALVIGGRAEPSLLDSYDAERRPVAEALLASTDRAFGYVVSDSRVAAILRTRVAPRVLATAMRFEAVRRAAFRLVSQTGIAYHASPLSRTLDGVGPKAPRAGDRFPWLQLTFGEPGPPVDLFERLDDTRFTLLTIGQPAPSLDSLDAGDLLRIEAVPEDVGNAAALAGAGIRGPAWYLIRPDGHVAIAGARFDARDMKAWLRATTIRLEREAPRQADDARAAAAGSTRAFSARDTAGARAGAIGASSRTTPPSMAASGMPSR